jgi:hypothetical protein
MIKLDIDGSRAAAGGEQLWRETCDLFAVMLREVFAPKTEILDSHNTYFVLIGNETASAVVEALPIIQKEMEKPTALDVGAKYQVLNEDQLTDYAAPTALP